MPVGKVTTPKNSKEITTQKVRNNLMKGEKQNKNCIIA